MTAEIRLGPWTALRMTGRLERPGEARDVEPKVMDLLFLLAEQRGEVVTKARLLEALWPGVTVGDDVLSRAVFKLRKALDDNPRQPRYIETIPKRGYRLLAGEPDLASAAPAKSRWPGRRMAIALVAGSLMLGTGGLGAVLLGRPAPATIGGVRASEAERLTRRADDLYFQFTRRDNEAAIVLYERAVAADPEAVAPRAGLANALVQQVIRYIAPAPERTTLGQAIAVGVPTTADGRARLARARTLAEGAVRDAPGDPAALKALGFVRSAQGDLAGAEAVYREALARDPDAWGVLINLGDIADLRGDRASAIGHLEQAYGAMDRLYGQEAIRISPWRARLGVDIAARHLAAGRPQEAEGWYRRVLDDAPLDPAATAGLARLLSDRGDRQAAARLCRDLVDRTGPVAGCAPFVE